MTDFVGKIVRLRRVSIGIPKKAIENKSPMAQ